MTEFDAATVSAEGQAVLDRIGNTPLLRLQRIAAATPHVAIFGKAEYFNPGGSVKDRPAWNMIREGERSGKLRPGGTIIDATSGNTGIAYAMIGAVRGYRVKLFLPENASPERKKILRAYGAELALTDAGEQTDGAIRACQAEHRAHPGRYFYPDQYGNPANWQAHYGTTGPEILRQTAGRLTHFVCGLGTSGTMMGVGRFLRERVPHARLVSMQPATPLHGLEGLKHMATTIEPDIYDESVAHESVFVETEDAYETVKRLAREEGLMVGISSGANVAAALRLAETLESGVIVTVLCDGADKYLSAHFWDD